MLKSRLQKLDGLTHTELKENITKTIKNIPKEKYKNIIKGAYERPEKYVSKKNKTRKIKGKYRKCDKQNTKGKVYKYFQRCL